MPLLATNTIPQEGWTLVDDPTELQSARKQLNPQESHIKNEGWEEVTDPTELAAIKGNNQSLGQTKSPSLLSRAWNKINEPNLTTEDILNPPSSTQEFKEHPFKSVGRL